MSESKYFGDPFNKPALIKREGLENLEPNLLHYSGNTRYVGDDFWAFWQAFFDLYETSYQQQEPRLLYRLIQNRQCLINRQPLRMVNFNSDQIKSVEGDGSVVLYSGHGFPQLYPDSVGHRIKGFAPFLKQSHSEDFTIPAGTVFSLNPSNVFRLEGLDAFAGNEEIRFLKWAELAVQRPIFAPIGLTLDSICCVLEKDFDLFLVSLNLDTLEQHWNF